MGSVMCQQIWDFWRSQLAFFILVQCGQMDSSCALKTMSLGSVMCQQIWDEFWRSQLVFVILVQCGQMHSSSVLVGANDYRKKCECSL